MDSLQVFVSVLIGVGLSAACGFRVFVPLLAMGVASRTGHLTLGDGFQWMESTVAIVAFGVATATEIGGFYIPWLDHALDVIATPAAFVAGTLATASTVGEMSPLLHWALAIIAGGGAATAVQATTALARGVSTATTGGLGNFIVATGELTMAAVMSLLAILLPVAAAVALVMSLAVGVALWLRRRARKAERALAETL